MNPPHGLLPQALFSSQCIVMKRIRRRFIVMSLLMLKLRMAMPALYLNFADVLAVHIVSSITSEWSLLVYVGKKFQ